MSVRVRSRRHRAGSVGGRSRRRGAGIVRRRLFIAAVLGTFVMVSCAIALTQRPDLSSPVRSDVQTLASETTGSNNSIAAPATDLERTVFPYSVIPGGVHSVEELRSAIGADAVVADHYKGFDLSKAHVERLAAPRFAHVSYRVGEHVYWTRNPLVLPAGERVITDGTNIARTRCGNQVASRPGITSSAEPSATVLDTPAATPPTLPSVPLVIPAANDLSASSISPPSAILLPALVVASTGPSNGGPNARGTAFEDPPVAISDGSSTAPTPNQVVPAVVPEPGSMVLVLTGAGGFVIRRFIANRRRDRR